MRALSVSMLFVVTLIGGLPAQASPASLLQHVAAAQPSRDQTNLGIGIGLSNNCYLIDRDDAGLAPGAGSDLVRECD